METGYCDFMQHKRNEKNFVAIDLQVLSFQVFDIKFISITSFGFKPLDSTPKIVLLLLRSLITLWRKQSRRILICGASSVKLRELF